MESMSLPFSSYCLGRKVEKGETLFLTFPLKQGRGKVLRVYLWLFLSDKFSLEENLKALLSQLSLYFHMVD